jgi:DNA repair protein RadD
MEMRWYQKKAVEAFEREARRKPSDDQLLVLPTGAGKTIVMANVIAKAIEWNMNVIVLARVKELISQNQDKFCRCFPELADLSGVYCAGLGMREPEKAVLFASVQSVVNKENLLGKRKLIIVDEAHQIPRSDESQYQKFLASMRKIEPAAKVLGLTASPYRLDGGVIFGPEQQFHSVAYNVPLSVLIKENYITKPQTLDVSKIDLKGVKKTGGDFNRADVETRFLKKRIGSEIVDAANSKGCKSVLVFASGVAHAERLNREIEACGEFAHVITGDTLPILRQSSIDAFTNRKIRYLINVDCLTTGFDAPCIDMIAVCRATESPGLFLQMVGRGFRKFAGKKVCWVLDYGQNVDRHGAIDSDLYGMDTISLAEGTGEAPKRVCPKCFEINFAAVRKCIRCGMEFPRVSKDLVASNKSILSHPEWLEVIETRYAINKGKDGKRDSLRVTYRCKEGNSIIGKRYVSEWVCFEHYGYARQKAMSWFEEMSYAPIPSRIEEFFEAFNNGKVAKVNKVFVKKDGKYDRVILREVAEKPPCD